MGRGLVESSLSPSLYSHSRLEGSSPSSSRVAARIPAGKSPVGCSQVRSGAVGGGRVRSGAGTESVASPYGRFLEGNETRKKAARVASGRSRPTPRDFPRFVCHPRKPRYTSGAQEDSGARHSPEVSAATGRGTPPRRTHEREHHLRSSPDRPPGSCRAIPRKITPWDQPSDSSVHSTSSQRSSCCFGRSHRTDTPRPFLRGNPSRDRGLDPSILSRES